MKKVTTGVMMLMVVLAGVSLAQEPDAVAKAAAASPVLKPFFGNARCPVTGRAVDRELYVEKDGQRIYVCGMRCKRKVKKAFADYLAKAYPEVKDLANAQCPVMPSRAAKEEITVDFQGHRIRFCCKRCVARFKEKPRLYLILLLLRGIEQVGNTMCPVMPEEKVQPEIFVIYEKKLVGLCCFTCVEDFEKSADAYLAAAEAQAKEAKK